MYFVELGAESMEFCAIRRMESERAREKHAGRCGVGVECSHVGEHPPTDIREGHIPRTEVYEPDDVIVDLLNVAAKTLVLGGRLAYLLPTFGE